jgi:hypothetical protein
MYYFVQLNDDLSIMLLGFVSAIGAPVIGMILGLTLLIA